MIDKSMGHKGTRLVLSCFFLSSSYALSKAGQKGASPI